MILFLCKVIQSESLLATWLPCRGNAVKLSEICGDSFCDKVSQVAQDSQVSQVPQMR